MCELEQIITNFLICMVSLHTLVGHPIKFLGQLWGTLGHLAYSANACKHTMRGFVTLIIIKAPVCSHPHAALSVDLVMEDLKCSSWYLPKKAFRKERGPLLVGDAETIDFKLVSGLPLL